MLLSKSTAIKTVIVILLISFSAHCQSSFNAFIGGGVRAFVRPEGSEKPISLTAGYRLFYLKHKFELFIYTHSESNFRTYHNLGGGFKVTYFKYYRPKTVYFYMDGHFAYFPKLPAMGNPQLLAFNSAGAGLMISRQNALELGLGYGSHTDLFENYFAKLALIHSFNIDFKKDKIFKQNPKNQLKCPKQNK